MPPEGNLPERIDRNESQQLWDAPAGAIEKPTVHTVLETEKKSVMDVAIAPASPAGKVEAARAKRDRLAWLSRTPDQYAGPAARAAEPGLPAPLVVSFRTRIESHPPVIHAGRGHPPL
jgi:hypothetical protein